ncbi:MAG: hypothetical protein DRG24_06530 [Epsilonproteobacteria bacterium]|nr:MAG: hypothetical protein DRG24_06530 [Campylobacterota bacterium]
MHTLSMMLFTSILLTNIYSVEAMAGDLVGSLDYNGYIHLREKKKKVDPELIKQQKCENLKSLLYSSTQSTEDQWNSMLNSYLDNCISKGKANVIRNNIHNQKYWQKLQDNHSEIISTPIESKGVQPVSDEDLQKKYNGTPILKIESTTVYNVQSISYFRNSKDKLIFEGSNGQFFFPISLLHDKAIMQDFTPTLQKKYRVMVGVSK